MDKPTLDKFPSYQSCSFFAQCAKELKEISQTDRQEKQRKRRLNNIQRMQNQQTKTQELDKMLLYNVVVDFLRSHKLNYSYSVFMSECNILSEQIVGKKKLSKILNIEDEVDNEEKFNISLVEVLVKKVQQIKRQLPKTQETGVQVEILQKDNSLNNALLMECRLEQVRKQVESRQKKYYEKSLEMMRSKEIMQLRQQITKNQQAKFQKQKLILKKRQEQINKKRKQYEGDSKLLKELEDLRQINMRISKENNGLKEDNKKINKQVMLHDCKKTEQYKNMEKSVKEQRKELQKKKMQLELALKNLNTKVEELVRQKQVINNQNKTDNFQNKVKIEKQNKDHMIQSIYGQLKQMEYRVKNLSDDNHSLRETNQKLQNKVKQYKKQQIKNEGNEGKCMNCEKKKLQQKFKPTTKNVLVGVEQDEIIQKQQPEYEVFSESDEEQKQRKAIESKNKIAKLQSDMRLFKNQVRILVSELQ